MKKIEKSHNKKLSLNKQTIANLDSSTTPGRTDLIFTTIPGICLGPDTSLSPLTFGGSGCNDGMSIRKCEGSFYCV